MPGRKKKEGWSSWVRIGSVLPVHATELPACRRTRYEEAKSPPLPRSTGDIDAFGVVKIIGEGLLGTLDNTGHTGISRGIERINNTKIASFTSPLRRSWTLSQSQRLRERISPNQHRRHFPPCKRIAADSRRSWQPRWGGCKKADFSPILFQGYTSHGNTGRSRVWTTRCGDSHRRVRSPRTRDGLIGKTRTGTATPFHLGKA